MLRNALLVSWRRLRRRPGASVISVGGLAVGLAVCLLIGLYVYHELSVDAFHAQSDRIVRLTKEVRTQGETQHGVRTSAPLARATEDALPQVEAAVRLFSGNATLRRGDTFLDVETVRFADPEFFDVFSFELQHGDPAMALSGPNHVVLSDRLARSAFGSANPIGETLDTRSGRTLTVTGVLRPIPPTSSIQGTAFVSMATMEEIYPQAMEEWFVNGFATYLLLNQPPQPDALEADLNALLERRTGETMQDLGIYNTLYVERLREAYFSPQGNPVGPTGSRTNVWLFGLIAACILGIACVNATNLATARASEREAEVGVRKAMGAGASQLRGHFLSEAALSSLLASGSAALLATAALPAFNRLAGTSLTLEVVPVGESLLALLGIAVVVTALAGVYPALQLTRFDPARALRGSGGTVGKGAGVRLRKGLIVVQFAVAVGLIAVTAVVYAQIDRLTNTELGFPTEQRLVLEGQTGSWSQTETVRRELASADGVQAVTASAGVPGMNEGTWFTTIHDDGEEAKGNIAVYSVDDRFADVYDLRLVAGRLFDPARASDSTRALVLNERAVGHFGFASPEEAVGARFEQLGRTGRVIGVVENFHFHSLHQPVGPLSLRMLDGGASTFTVDLAGASVSRTMADLRDRWAELLPAQPFAASFLDDRFDAMYRADRRFGRLFGAASGLALGLACLGLFGLVAVTVQQRRREIGLRKALGASVGSIVGLLTREVLVLVGIATAVATPLAYVGASRWLDGFAVTVDLGPTWFVAAGAVVAVVACATAGYHAVRAASVSPAQTLQAK